MSIISSVQFELSRKRKALEQALEQKDWSGIQQLDAELVALMQAAAVDPQRDPMVLLKELGKVLALYRELVNQSQNSVFELSLSLST